MTAGGGREERKQQTRQALLDAALRLIGNNESFSSLSLREVTREAGIVPTAFYRHFQDMEGLGLALVGECFRSLRQMMRDARAGGIPTERVIARSVEIFGDYVRTHPLHIRFIARERFGGVAALRTAIRNELRLFVSDLATDLSRFPVLNRWRTDDLQMMAGLIVNTVVAAAEQILDTDAPGDLAEIQQRTEQQLRLIVLGVPQWKTARPEA